MGQDECLEFLKEKKKWVTTKKVGEILNQRASVVRRSLNRLFWSEDIERKYIDNKRHKGYKWRIR